METIILTFFIMILIFKFNSRLAIENLALRQQLAVMDLALLSSRVVAFLMEPKHISNREENLATMLDLLIEIENAKENVTALKNAVRWQGYSKKIKSKQKYRSVNLTKTIERIFEILEEDFMVGKPKIDWLSARRLLRESNVKELQAVNSAVQYL